MYTDTGITRKKRQNLRSDILTVRGRLTIVTSPEETFPRVIFAPNPSEFHCAALEREQSA